MSSAIQLPDSPGGNLLINSNFQVAQLGTAFTAATTPANSDDTYLLDQWILLSDGNDVVDIDQDTSQQPEGSGTCAKFTVATANKKFAFLQVLENKRSVLAVGDSVSLSFEAKKVAGNATLETLRAAVISWDSTADTVTSDVVSVWEAAGTDPTLVANWTYENTPSNLTLTDSYQTFKIENVSVDTASTANIGVLIWCDDTDATAADIAYLGNVKLEVTAKATQYVAPAFDVDLSACQRFYLKSFIYGTAPAQGVGATSGEFTWTATKAGAVVQYSVRHEYIVTQRAAGTLTFYNPVSANAFARDEVANVDCSATSGANNGNFSGFYMTVTTHASTAVGNVMGVHYEADARL